MPYRCDNTKCRLINQDVTQVDTVNAFRCISCRRPLIFLSDPLDNFKDDAGKQMADKIDAEVLEEVREDESERADKIERFIESTAGTPETWYERAIRLINENEGFGEETNKPVKWQGGITAHKDWEGPSCDDVAEEIRDDETPGVCGDSVINTESEGLKNLMSSRVPSKSLLARDKAKAKKEFLDLTSAPAPMTIVDVVEEVREDIKSMLVRGGEEAKKKLLEFTNENVVDWIDARDNVNELFKGLIHEANKINAQVKVHQLMELNREMIDLIYQEYGIGD